LFNSCLKYFTWFDTTTAYFSSPEINTVSCALGEGSVANFCANIAVRPAWDSYVEFDGGDPAVRARLRAEARGKGHQVLSQLDQQASKFQLPKMYSGTKRSLTFDYTQMPYMNMPDQTLKHPLNHYGWSTHCLTYLQAQQAHLGHQLLHDFKLRNKLHHEIEMGF